MKYLGACIESYGINGEVVSIANGDPSHLLQSIQVEAIDAVVILVMVNAVVQAEEALAVIVRPADGSIMSWRPQGFGVWRGLWEIFGRFHEAPPAWQRFAPTEHELLGDVPVVRARAAWGVVHVLFQKWRTLVAFVPNG